MRDPVMNEEHHAKEYQSRGVVPFWPEHFLKEMVIGITALGTLFVFGLFVHPALGHIADPADWAYVPAPDWYFYSVQNFFDVAGFYWSQAGLVKYDWILMFLIPFLGIVVLYAVPWIDRYRERRLLKRPLMFGLLVVGILAMGYFTVNGVYAHDTLVAQEPVNIFKSSCETCHAINGLGGNTTGVIKTPTGQYIYPPNLTHVGSYMTPAEIKAQLVNPVGGMPQLSLPPAAVKDLVPWLAAHK
ncbi:Cytochrome c domain-containing protein [Candidatus Hydrogenisulfobacillus filiaventi]|uniref:Cytochrome c domain-containing protein n=1 Tax=Candidatus Hydrogenisulfobacillus filiaventi TaxID=2707344 RepID=A0A6F8ZFY7_9FIRM|nr:c-type cytochrome [Bacillota bacterium]CAB1128509.1 Cytochrome c domain-containing protein [Candidatus Hydrogenisulfobacillus filiaventi]